MPQVPVDPGSEIAYSVGRFLILVKQHAPVSAYELARHEGVNPRTYQRYVMGLEAAGLEVRREKRKIVEIKIP